WAAGPGGCRATPIRGRRASPRRRPGGCVSLAPSRRLARPVGRGGRDGRPGRDAGRGSCLVRGMTTADAEDDFPNMTLRRVVSLLCLAACATVVAGCGGGTPAPRPGPSAAPETPPTPPPPP